MSPSLQLRLAAIALLVSITVLSLAVFRHWKGKRTRLTPVRVQLKWKNQAQFAGFYVAKANKYYEAAGLDVQLLEGGLDKPAIQAVVSGTAEFGVIGPEAILLARSRNVDVTAIAVIYQKSPFCLFTLDRYPVRKIADLKGKSVGVLYGSNELIGYRTMLKHAGLEVRRDNIHEVLVQYDLGALRTGEVQAFPGYSIDEADDLQEECDNAKPSNSGCNVHVLEGSDVGNFGDTLFTTGRYIENNRSVVEKFVQATLKGWQYALTNQPFGLSTTLDQKTDSPMNAKHQCLMLKNSIGYICPGPSACKLGYMSYDQWKLLQKRLIEDALLDKDRQEDLTKAFDPEFVDRSPVVIRKDELTLGSSISCR